MSSAQKIIQAAAGNAAGAGTYVEEVFSTYLYDGNGSTQTITNGIDLDGEGGLVWVKSRSNASEHHLFDTERGTGKYLFSDTTAAEGTASDTLTAYNSNGMSFGSNNGVNGSSRTYASWTFRKAPKFFDVVTYTGNLTARTISHNLGSVPGTMIIKETSGPSSWIIYHRSLGNTAQLKFDTGSQDTGQSTWNSTTPTDTEFSLGAVSSVNNTGDTYVAYLFAHNDGDGEFGEDADQDIIKCGSFTSVSGGSFVDLGFEPQWVLIKSSSSASNWYLWDTMRGIVSSGQDPFLAAQKADSETTDGIDFLDVNATGFTEKIYNALGSNVSCIYIAIRRGPMKTPESGTEVLESVAYTGNGASNRTIGSTVTPDFVLLSDRDGTSTQWSSYAHYFFDRVRGDDFSLATSNTNSEVAGWSGGYFNLDQQIGWSNGSNSDYTNNSGTDYVSHHFRRAPGFFDVVAYEGNGSTQNVSHNLGAVPELLIVKRRDSAAAWGVYSAATGNSELLQLESSGASQSSAPQWNNTTPTATVFSLGTSSTANASGGDYIAYLFATLPGISKVFSVTKSSGSDATVDCGFSAGSRFVLLKRTDSTGDWYVWDSERGIVTGNDPYLLLNSTAAEVTSTDYIDPVSSGFTIVNGGLADGDYIGLAVS